MIGGDRSADRVINIRGARRGVKESMLRIRLPPVAGPPRHPVRPRTSMIRRVRPRPVRWLELPVLPAFSGWPGSCDGRSVPASLDPHALTAPEDYPKMTALSPE